LEKLPRSATAEAVNDVELIAIGTNDFKFLVRQHPEIAMKVLAKFSARLRDADNLISLLLLGDITGHVIHTLVRMALTQSGMNRKLPKESHLQLTDTELAAKANISEVEVDRVLSELARIRLIKKVDDGIVLKRHKKLRNYLDYVNWKSRG